MPLLSSLTVTDLQQALLPSTTEGVDTADVTLTSGTSGAFGAWSEILDPTTKVVVGVYIVAQGGTDADETYTLQLGVGGLGAEVAAAPLVTFGPSVWDAANDSGSGPVFINNGWSWYRPCYFASGVRIAAQLACQTSGAAETWSFQFGLALASA